MQDGEAETLVRRERHAVVLETLADRDARYPSLVGAGFMFDHAMACIPMLTGGRAVGGVVVSFADARTFTEDELTFLVALAAQGAVASERARLHQAEHRILEVVVVQILDRAPEADGLLRGPHRIRIEPEPIARQRRGSWFDPALGQIAELPSDEGLRQAR